MANPQTENGYTKIANEVLDHICQLKLNGTQYKVILVIWRYTYGFSRKEHELSESFIAKATKTHKIQLSKEINKLIDINIIHVMREASFTQSRILSFNKNYSEWINRQLVNSLTPNENNNTTVSESTNTTVSESTNQDNQNIKQNINIDHTAVETDENLFNNFWNSYPRKVARVAARKAFKKLKVDSKILDKMLSSLENQKQSKQWQDKQFIPHPATWLNQRRWEDETDETGESRETALIRTAAGTFKF